MTFRRRESKTTLWLLSDRCSERAVEGDTTGVALCSARYMGLGAELYMILTAYIAAKA